MAFIFIGSEKVIGTENIPSSSFFVEDAEAWISVKPASLNSVAFFEDTPPPAKIVILFSAKTFNSFKSSKPQLLFRVPGEVDPAHPKILSADK